jgi:hypothetical protein
MTGRVLGVGNCPNRAAQGRSSASVAPISTYMNWGIRQRGNGGNLTAVQKKKKFEDQSGFLEFLLLDNILLIAQDKGHINERLQCVDDEKRICRLLCNGNKENGGKGSNKASASSSLPSGHLAASRSSGALGEARRNSTFFFSFFSSRIFPLCLLSVFFSWSSETSGTCIIRSRYSGGPTKRARRSGRTRRVGEYWRCSSSSTTRYLARGAFGL